MDRGSWRAVIHGVAKELDMTEWLSDSEPKPLPIPGNPVETCSPPESPPESEEDQREALGEHRSGESQASLPVLMQLERAEAWSFEDGQASVGPEPPLMGSWGRVSVLEDPHSALEPHPGTPPHWIPDSGSVNHLTWENSQNHICSLNLASQPQMAAGTERPTHQPPSSPSQSMATQSFLRIRPQTFRSPPAPLFSLMLYSQPVSNCDWPCFQIHDGTTSHHPPLLWAASRLHPPAWISVAIPGLTFSAWVLPGSAWVLPGFSRYSSRQAPCKMPGSPGSALLHGSRPTQGRRRGPYLHCLSRLSHAPSQPHTYTTFHSAPGPRIPRALRCPLMAQARPCRWAPHTLLALPGRFCSETHLPRSLLCCHALRVSFPDHPI